MKFYFSSFIALSLTVAIGQPAAMFETTIYFEDAVGNKDSVIVGYDTLATTGIDDAFGEMEILFPFDSVFEVRVGVSYGSNWNKTSKKSIGPAEQILHNPISQDCHIAAPIFIYVWAMHHPVKVSWDTLKFLQDICVRGSLISNHEADEFLFPYDWNEVPQNLYYCMATEDEFQIDLSATAIIGANVFHPISIEKEVKGIGLQNIYGLRFYPAPVFYETPCYWIVATSDVNSPKEINLFPNPASEIINWTLPEEILGKQALIFDGQGKIISSISKNVNSLSIKGLLPGLYFLMVQADNGKMYSAKFVKY